METFRYAGYPSAPVFNKNGKQVHHLLWGDWVWTTGKPSQGRQPVQVRGVQGWMYERDLQDEQLLEIVFVDVGQGDGTLLITPQDKHIVVDAGLGNNMYRFLRWRYGGFRKKWTFDAAVITHPDADHYEGFRPLFEDQNVHFNAIYHNGIMEQCDSNFPLGKVTSNKSGPRYLTDLVPTHKDLLAFLADKKRWQHPKSRAYDKQYPSLLHGIVESGRCNNVRMLSVHESDAGYMPGYGPKDLLSIEVLGPVDEPANGCDRLRCFDKTPDGGGFDVGKTKNGHSIILKLRYHDVTVLLGGDLNTSSQASLLQHYAGSPLKWPWSDSQEATLVTAAAKTFAVDVAKCCHHGTSDFADAFIRSTLPAATVICSGDNESHAHPRCDTLGAIGRAGRGCRPLIFCTELARSTRETEAETRESMGRLRERIARASGNDRAKLQQQYDSKVDKLLKRNVTVYGAVHLRTDGRKVAMAYMLERLRCMKDRIVKWDIYRLEPDGTGELAYVKD